jgi:hypothetical protein
VPHTSGLRAGSFFAFSPLTTDHCLHPPFARNYGNATLPVCAALKRMTGANPVPHPPALLRQQAG